MLKHATFAITLVLAAVCGLQQLQIVRLGDDLKQAQADIRTLDVQQSRSDAAVQILHSLGLENRKQLKEFKRRRTLTVTAYSPRTEETDSTPYTTATNSRVRQGIVAVSRDLFNQGWVFGKRVYIKNYGVYVIDDLMADHKKNQVDIFMFDTSKALNFGKKELTVHLLDA